MKLTKIDILDLAEQQAFERYCHHIKKYNESGKTDSEALRLSAIYKEINEELKKEISKISIF